MARTDSDSDVGRRLEPRARTKLFAALVTLRGLQQACVESLSPHGAGLSVDNPPEIGSEVVLAWPIHAISGTIAWVEGRRCGVSFSRGVSEAVIEEIVRTDGGTDVTESFRMTEGFFTTLFGLFGGQLRTRRNVRDMRKTLERIKAVVEG